MRNRSSATTPWLMNEDRGCFESRLTRLDWLVGNVPQNQYWRFQVVFLRRACLKKRDIALCMASFWQPFI